MTLDQIELFVKSTQRLVARDLASLVSVIATGSRADKDGLTSFMKALESR